MNFIINGTHVIIVGNSTCMSSRQNTLGGKENFSCHSLAAAIACITVFSHVSLIILFSRKERLRNTSKCWHVLDCRPHQSRVCFTFMQDASARAVFGRARFEILISLALDLGRRRKCTRFTTHDVRSPFPTQT